MVHGLVRGQTSLMMTQFVLVRASKQKSETTGFGQENCHILHCRFLFKLTFWSSLDLGCWETCAETSSKKSLPISQSSGLKEMFRRWMRWRKWTTFPALSWSRSFSRQCSARLSAMKVWYIIENRACASMCKHVQQSFRASASRGKRMSALIRTLSRLS